MLSGERIVKSRLRLGFANGEVYLDGNMLDGGIDEIGEDGPRTEAGGDGGRAEVAKKSAVRERGLSDPW